LAVGLDLEAVVTMPLRPCIRLQAPETPIHLDPRSPFVLDTRELGRRPGSMVRVHRTVPAPADLGTEVIAVPEGSDVDLDLRLESVVEGVLVSGTVTATAAGQCVRCLDDLERRVEVDVLQLYAYPGQVPTDVEDDETDELEGDLIDFEPVLRDTVVLALPFQPVCRPDCPGLCSECGARLADDPEHQHEWVDPRWAALQSLTAGPRAAADDTAADMADLEEEN
jgi:uncharacterized protein